MSDLRLVVVDVDGCLTDGKQYVDVTGDKLFKAFHSRDIRSIRELVSKGVRVIAISADDWLGGVEWCRKAGAEYVCARDKLETVLALGYSPDEVAVVGDDVWDLVLMRWAGVCFFPSNSDKAVMEWAQGVRRKGTIAAMVGPGGSGIMTEVVRDLYRLGRLT